MGRYRRNRQQIWGRYEGDIGEIDAVLGAVLTADYGWVG